MNISKWQRDENDRRASKFMNLRRGISPVGMRVFGRLVLVALFAAVVADASEASNATSEAVDEDKNVQGWNSMPSCLLGYRIIPTASFFHCILNQKKMSRNQKFQSRIVLIHYIHGISLQIDPETGKRTYNGYQLVRATPESEEHLEILRFIEKGRKNEEGWLTL